MPAPLAIVLPVRFNEAIRAASRRKVTLPADYYGDLQANARTRAFTVSGLTSIAQIRYALDSMNQGLRDGMTFSEWKAKAAAIDFGLSSARLDTILRAHTQTAYNAGAWEQFDRLQESRGYLMYSAINDSRTRPTHRAMDGIIKPVGDPFWDTHSPPCGFNCRCGLVSLDDQQVANRGGSTPSAEISSEARADTGWGAKPEHGGIDTNEDVLRHAIDLPGPLQQQILDWQQLISEERIVDNVRGFFSRYDEFASDVAPFLEETDGLLAEHEAVSIYGYTGSHYQQMNAFLRARGGDNPHIMSAISSAASGLAKLPAFEGSVYRGIYLERVADPVRFLTSHAVGEVVEYSAFTSASYTEAFHANVQMTIYSRSGRVVEELSQNAGEFEVLFAPGTKFRVRAIDTHTSPVRIDLEELQDQSIDVPPSNRFGKKGQKPPMSEAAQNRAQDEVGEVDPAALERFKAEHDGMTPIQYALSRNPSARMEVEQAFPHLVAPKKK